MILEQTLHTLDEQRSSRKKKQQKRKHIVDNRSMNSMWLSIVWDDIVFTKEDLDRSESTIFAYIVRLFDLLMLES